MQKFLAARGLGSRREIEGWIEQGRLQVNGVVATLGARVDGSERLSLNGKPLRFNINLEKRKRVLMYHKPEGELCSRTDPEGRRTVFDNLPGLRHERWVQIGRLDVNTSGLLLLTTDGELAHRCMHPSYEIERRYAVRVLGAVEDAALGNLRTGVQLDDGEAHFDSLIEAGGEGANHWYHVMLREGRNREVRRLWESQGITVSRLIRIGYGPIELQRGLPRGKFRDATVAETKALYSAVDLDAPDFKNATGPAAKGPQGGRGKRY